MNTSHESTLEKLRQRSAATDPATLAADEEFWACVAAEFAAPDDFIQFEYGFYHPACHAVIAEEVAALRAGQRRGSHYKRNESRGDYEAARADLARLAGAEPAEVAITRSATEALNIIIQGLPLSHGDEVVCSDQDYGSMIEAWEQRARRDGLVLRPVKLPSAEASDDDVVASFAAAFTPRTRVLHLTHLINFTGQLLPVAQLSALARGHGVQVVVDAAHSFAQIDFTPAKLDCDYLGASLHKWLAAPLGLGLLYVRRDRIGPLAPLFGDTRLPVDDIRKLEHFGNRPDSAHRGLREAIRWHAALGTAAKQARLHLLQRCWTEAVRALPRLRVLTPRDPARHGAIGTFAIEGVAPRVIVDYLMKEHRIFVNAFEGPVVHGVRVTPGLTTLRTHIDRLVPALEAASRVLT